MHSKPDKLMPSLYGGIFVATIVTVPIVNFINGCCCAGILLGGIFSVLMYQRKFTEEAEPLTLKDCIHVGLYTGIISVVLSVFMQLIVELLFGKVQLEIMMQILDKVTAKEGIVMPQWFNEMVEVEMQNKPTFFGAVASMIVQVIPYSIFTVLGSIIGWNIFKPKNN
ncbi:MAG: hypothetical protein H3C35_11225 [Bacteroidetes bacterium]|nr:hypothetical protein [Bacteroidota bacterium]